MFETIAVPLDGSELAEQALLPAAELALRLQAKVVLVQAVDSLAQRMSSPPAMLEAPSAAAASIDILQKSLDAEKAAAREYLSARRDSLASRGLNAEAFVGEGPAADVILSVARDEAAGMIVMSTHGRGGLGRLVFGSVADAVLKRADLPVLLVRSKAHP